MQVQFEGLKSALKESTATVMLNQNSVGRLSRMDALQGQQMAMESERRRKIKLIEIIAALKRIEEDNFGFCEVCDEEIILDRLSIDPTVTRCVNCCC